MIVDPPPRVPLWLRPGLWVARLMTGKDPLPGRVLAHAPRSAIGFGLFELFAAHAPRDLDARTLAAARIAASVAVGCPFCIDMNAAQWRSAGLTQDELALLLESPRAPRAPDGADALDAPMELDGRVRVAVAYARALSATPVVIGDDLVRALTDAFAPREIVVLAATIAQVNTWARFNHGLGIPAAGFFDESSCSVRLPAHTP